MLYPVIALVSSLIGFVIGVCGVSGFLLPIFLINYCGFAAASGLFISYSCFLAGSAIGVRNYYRRGEVPMETALPLSLSSLGGAVCGAVIGRFFVSEHIKTVLYAVVLISGVMIFLQDLMNSRRKNGGQDRTGLEKSVLIPLGFLTALICSMAGAGGPVIVMPLLVVLGMPIRYAIGIALFDSMFIALPPILIYGSSVELKETALPLLAAAAGQILGILLGSRAAAGIPQRPVKLGVALFSVIFALWKLLS